MLYNSFLDRFGPQTVGAFPRQQAIAPEDLDFAVRQQAQRDAQNLGLRQQMAAQQAGNIQEGIGLGARLAGYGVKAGYNYLKTGVPTLSGAAISAGATVGPGALSRVSTGFNATPAATGGGAAATGIFNPTPAATALSSAPSSGVNAASTTGTSLLGATGQVLGIAGQAYGLYSGIQGSLGGLHSLRSAQRSGALMPEEESAAVAQMKREGLKSAAIGGTTGALSGAATGAAIGAGGGPIGAAIGGIAGAAGGLIQHFGAKKKRDR